MKHISQIKNIRQPQKREVSILLTSLLLGLLISLQAQSFQDVSDVINRNNRADIFREITILKDTNDTLQSEIESLQEQLIKTSDNEQARQSIAEEIQTYKALTGQIDISGPGITLTVQGDIQSLWLTDVVSELFTAGADAVSINGIRLTNATIGLDTIPSGQITLHGNVLSQPYVVDAIGERQVLQDALMQPEGILERMERIVSGVQLDIQQRDNITMKKVAL